MSPADTPKLSERDLVRSLPVFSPNIYVFPSLGNGCVAQRYCEWGVVHSITFHRGAQKGRLFLPAYAHAHSRIVYYIAGWGRAPPRELNYMYYGTTAVKYLRAPRHAHTARM